MQMEQTNSPAVCELADARQCMERIKEQSDRYFEKTGLHRRAYVLTFGCQQNEADSEHLAGMAEAMGYVITGTPDEADLILVNTCAIREHAEQKALSTVGQFKHFKAKNPALIIAVGGCMVTQPSRADEIKHRYPYVDLVFGTASVHLFPRLLWDKIEKGKRLYAISTEDTHICEGLPIKRESSYRAWVSVMYGCNNFCSYCIVPYVRGRERSRRREAVIREVRELVEAGYKDITLLGQNVNSYGKDLDTSYDFADLLRELDEIEGDYVLRFMTSHPKDASRKLIDVMANSEHIARQFHLPMQSGSDAILQKMNRHYDTEQYLATVDYLREKIPDVTLSSDIIVGFPGETEEDFEGTLAMLRRVRFDMLFSFIYSQRRGTPAATMEDQIPKEVQNARFERLLALQKEIGEEKNQALLHTPMRVLCDGVSKSNPALYSGRTEGNKIAFFEGTPDDTGKYITFEADRADAFAFYGKKI